MKFIVLAIIGLILIQPTIAADLTYSHNYEAGRSYSFESTILGETQTLSIALPEGYRGAGEQLSFPIIYVLDGHENQFRAVTASAYMGNTFGARIPQAIVIGIPSNNRHRDYLPYDSDKDFYGNYSKKYAASGGGLKYRRYLETELFPLIESRYRTNGQRILIGHSTGAHFALFDLMQPDRLFHSYIAIDPNLWVGEGYLGALAEAAGKTDNMFSGRLFLSVAPRKERVEFQETRVIQMLNGIKAMSERADNILLKRFDRENHQSILPLSYHYGLQHVFDGYEPPDFEQVARQPDILRQHYEIYSKEMRTTYLPDPDFINIAAHTALNHFKLLDNALLLYQMNVELYPKRAYSWGALAYYYLSVADKVSALEAYKKALELDPEDGFYIARIRELSEDG